MSQEQFVSVITIGSHHPYDGGVMGGWDSVAVDWQYISRSDPPGALEVNLSRERLRIQLFSHAAR